MTSPLVFKAFNLIQKLNQFSYIYVVSWDPSTRSLLLTEKFRKLIPWHIANIGVVFLVHFCLSIFLILHGKATGTKLKMSNKEALEFGSLAMMACHCTASLGINFLFPRHCKEFVAFFNALLKFEANVQGYYVSSKEIKEASVWKELNAKRLGKSQLDTLGLVMHSIIHTLTVVPAITPISLVIEGVDPIGLFLKRIIFPQYVLSHSLQIALIVIRLLILTIAMLEISQTFRTVFNFGMSVFHIYRKCLGVSCLTTWQGAKTIIRYNQFRILHNGMIGFITPLAAFYLGLNFIILTISTVLCLVSHRILPFQIYIGIPAVAIMDYFLLFATLPVAIYSHEESKRLCLQWRMQMGLGKAMTSFSYWEKVLRAFRPLSFYCGSTGLLTQRSKRIYMAAVIDGTVNVLLWRKGLSN